MTTEREPLKPGEARHDGNLSWGIGPADSNADDPEALRLAHVLADELCREAAALFGPQPRCGYGVHLERDGFLAHLEHHAGREAADEAGNAWATIAERGRPVGVMHFGEVVR